MNVCSKGLDSIIIINIIDHLNSFIECYSLHSSTHTSLHFFPFFVGEGGAGGSILDVFDCFHNPWNSDIYVDYRIFNVIMWSFCMCSHRGPLLYSPI